MKTLLGSLIALSLLAAFACFVSVPTLPVAAEPTIEPSQQAEIIKLSQSLEEVEKRCQEVSVDSETVIDLERRVVDIEATLANVKTLESRVAALEKPEPVKQVDTKPVEPPNPVVKQSTAQPQWLYSPTLRCWVDQNGNTRCNQ